MPNPKKTVYPILLFVFMLGRIVPARAETADAFQFFEEEGKVISASRLPQTRAEAPATVYVVTSKDIQDSGAQNIWDALRSVPGVDVVQARTGQAEISIRGLNQPNNNRTLILLDGKTVLNGLFDYVTWDTLPVTMDEIDRIEIVEGPASAVYGANAVSGVINIISKTAEQLHGGIARYTVGERNTQIGSFVYGKKQGALNYKVGAGWDSINAFERSDRFASQAGKLNTALGVTLSENSDLNLSGGLSHINTEKSIGAGGAGFEKGLTSYTRADYRFKETRLRTFWNHGQTRFDDLPSLDNPTLDYDTYDADIEQSAALPFKNQAVVGASYRKNTARSTISQSRLLEEDLWALFAEDRWDIADSWALMTSGRVDRHPYTPIAFSPRGSILFTPVPQHVFRLSVGTAFRNPTILENSVDENLTVANPGISVPNPPITAIQTHVIGNRTLDAERIETEEIAHNGTFGNIKTSITGFHYKLSHIIQANVASTTFAPPNLDVISSYWNGGAVSAWGGEMGVAVALSQTFSTFANYSYQYLHQDSIDQTIALESPRHKANAGLQYRSHGFNANTQLHWVDRTLWPTEVNGALPIFSPVNSYFLLDAHAGYAFSGRWDGFEIGVTAFNLLNHDHYELLPVQPSGAPGQNGEIIRQRVTATASYKF